MNKRTMHNPEYFEGKRISVGKWNLPDGWDVCAYTGRLHRWDDLMVTFPHTRFDRQWLLDHNLYVEDAEWLSVEGWDQMVAKLEALGNTGPLYLM